MDGKHSLKHGCTIFTIILFCSGPVWTSGHNLSAIKKVLVVATLLTGNFCSKITARFCLMNPNEPRKKNSYFPLLSIVLVVFHSS